MKVDEQKVRDYLKSKKICECPLCHAKNSFGVVENVAPIPLPFDLGNDSYMFSEKFRHLPAVLLACGNCGCIQFLSTKAVGL